MGNNVVDFKYILVNILKEVLHYLNISFTGMQVLLLGLPHWCTWIVGDHV